MQDIDMLEGALRHRGRRIEELERQRDELREALEAILAAYDEGAGRISSHYPAVGRRLMGAARAALKATKEDG